MAKKEPFCRKFVMRGGFLLRYNDRGTPLDRPLAQGVWCWPSKVKKTCCGN